MTCGVREDLEVCVNNTLRRTYRLHDGTVSFAAISGITNTAPAVVTAASHGIPTRWTVSVHSVSGMTEINASRSPPRERDLCTVTSTGANTLELDGVDAIDYGAYTSGGTLRYLTPVDLAAGDASVVVYDSQGGAVLTTWDVGGGEIELDNTNKRIELTVTTTALQAFTWTLGWYEFRVVDASGVTWGISEGYITLGA